MNLSTVQMHWFLIILLLPLIICFWIALLALHWMIMKRIQNPEAGYLMIRWNICQESICIICRQFEQFILDVKDGKMISTKSSVQYVRAKTHNVCDNYCQRVLDYFDITYRIVQETGEDK